MKIICLLLCILPLTTAKVIHRTGVNDVFDGVEGVMYDIPEYEDPEVSLFKLIARGVMPVYTIRDVIKDSEDVLNKDDKPHYQTDDIKKGLEAVISQLQEAKKKLEDGNTRIYMDINKSVLNLENLKHHLYLDLHTVDASKKHLAISEGSLNKASTDKYALLKKYLSSDDSIYKYLSFGIPTEKSSSDNPADLSLESDTVLAPYPSPVASAEQPSVDYKSAEQSYGSISFKEINLRPDTEQTTNMDSTTEQPLVFKYELLRTEMPLAEATPDEKKVETYTVDDASSTEADKVDQADKTLIRKKWSLKLSSAF